MAELTPKERLQPSLLDRLTDDEPDKQQESRDKRVLSPRQLRKSVIRDLEWLLNAGDLASVRDISRYSHVIDSVLNFGLPDLAGKHVSGLQVASLERMLRGPDFGEFTLTPISSPGAYSCAEKRFP
mgnify:CR=1 FL=1